MPDWTVFGLPALVVMVALINALKEMYGLPTKWALPVAVLSSAVLGTGLYFSGTYEAVKVAMDIVLGSILIGLAVTGYYSGTKSYVVRREVEPAIKEMEAHIESLEDDKANLLEDRPF